MSLRVLLADESASIRKVFQMGLQDYGADVKSVQNGLDVLEVAQSYKPDIIFADILLQKKNGYEVCQEICNDAELSRTPVILMWSSFMEMDQGKYKASGAKGELEKPFDVEKMRDLIKNFVETSRNQQLSHFLTFPKSITSEFIEEEKGRNKSSSEAMPTPVAGVPETEPSTFEIEEQDEVALSLDGETPSPADLEATSEFNIKAEDHDDEEEEFNMFEVPPQADHSSEETVVETRKNNDENWEAKPLNDTQLLDPTETDQDLDQFQSMDLGKEKKLNLDDFLYKPQTNSESESTPFKTAVTGEIHNVNVPNYENTTPSAHVSMGLDEMESVVRAETRRILSQVIKDQLPTILERVVREELEKVMQQEMALKSAGQSPG